MGFAAAARGVGACRQARGFVAESLAYVQLSHVWWGVWGLLQATQSSIDFDYVGYARCRLDALCTGHCLSETEEFGGAAAGNVEF